MLVAAHPVHSPRPVARLVDGRWQLDLAERRAVTAFRARLATVEGYFADCVCLPDDDSPAPEGASRVGSPVNAAP